MPRLVKKNSSSIRRYLSDPVSYGQKHNEYSGWKRKASSRDERNVIRTAPNSSTSLNEINAELGIDVCPFFVPSSVTDVAHIHSNKTMLPLTPATPQRTCSRVKESKCSIGQLAARTSVRLRICGSFRSSCLLKWTTIKNIQDRKTALQREWDAVSVGEPKKPVATMPNRMFSDFKKMVEKPAVDNCLRIQFFSLVSLFRSNKPCSCCCVLVKEIFRFEE
uniref:Transposable element Tc3 transposase-like DNA-binding HTH domain-containing protein n=1 Tax=Caenorhabditis japonica TaxID=281687 RepID=A0A8R1EI60_CAEJA